MISLYMMYTVMECKFMSNLHHVEFFLHYRLTTHGYAMHHNYTLAAVIGAKGTINLHSMVI